MSKPVKLRKAKFTTDADLAIKGAYTPADVPPTDATVEGAGIYPYTRGVQETMYRGQF